MPPNPPTGPDAPPTQSAPRKRSRTPLVIGLLVLLLALGGGGFTAFSLLSDSDSDTTKIVFPDEWDERVLPYVKIAEEERDLEFKHPVEVRFLDPEVFVEERRTEEDELTDEDRQEIEQTTGLFRALGLLSGEVDLLKAFQDFQDSGTLAYYAFKEKRITIRGTTITPAVKSTLVHELVHVLQDQHFDISSRTQELSKEIEEGDDTTTESTVLDAVIEGDASRIESQYEESLSTAERKALTKSQEEQNKEPSEAYKSIPEIVVTIQTAPYVLGEAVVQAVFEDGGNSAVDDLFTDTPQHESALLDAFEVLADDIDAKDVDEPSLVDGEEKFDAGEFGGLTLYFVLAERLPLREALAAADGWGGDRYVAYERDGTSCFKIAYQGDSDADTDQMFGALQDWIAVAPGTGEVERQGDGLLFGSCDPGEEGHEGKDASQDALTLATARTYLGLTLLREGAPVKIAGCLAEGLIQDFSIAELNDPELAEDPAVQAKIQRIGLGCR